MIRWCLFCKEYRTSFVALENHTQLKHGVAPPLPKPQYTDDQLPLFPRDRYKVA